jgi:hypothetical protein
LQIPAFLVFGITVDTGCGIIDDTVFLFFFAMARLSAIVSLCGSFAKRGRCIRVACNVLPIIRGVWALPPPQNIRKAVERREPDVGYASATLALDAQETERNRLPYGEGNGIAIADASVLNQVGIGTGQLPVIGTPVTHVLNL